MSCSKILAFKIHERNKMSGKDKKQERLNILRSTLFVSYAITVKV